MCAVFFWGEGGGEEGRKICKSLHDPTPVGVSFGCIQSLACLHKIIAPTQSIGVWNGEISDWDCESDTCADGEQCGHCTHLTRFEGGGAAVNDSFSNAVGRCPHLSIKIFRFLPVVRPPRSLDVQNIWSSTKRVGCGQAICNTNSPFSVSDTWVFVVCNYAPYAVVLSFGGRWRRVGT